MKPDMLRRVYAVSSKNENNYSSEWIIPRNENKVQLMRFNCDVMKRTENRKAMKIELNV